MDRLRALRDYGLRHCGLMTFLLGLLLSAAIFVPVMVENDGIFMYYGDFNAQEIPFYQLVHDEILRGNTGWTSLTDLGSSLFSSYSFYLTGSPFFWITLLFPSAAVPYLMGPLFMLKFACAGLTAYLYLKRYVNSPAFAAVGGLLYAFSGFSIYNIFFFHFHEPMIVFPLLLLAVDEFMYENRRGVLAPAVFAACIINYYFFAGMAVFVVIYWFILVFTNNYKIDLKKLSLLAFEVIIGFLATAFLILPTVLFISGNPRLSVLPDGYDALVYNMPQRYWYIILSFFFPPELAAQPNFTPSAGCNWASVSGWLPLLSMTGVIGYMQLKKRDWLKKLILLLIVMALVPVLNSVFQMLNSSIYYARWFYMLILMFTLATVRALENSETDWLRAVNWSTGITVATAFLIGIMPNTIYDEDENPTTYVGVMEYIARYWIYVAIALLGIFVFTLIIIRYKNRKTKLACAVTAGICIISLLSSTYIVQTGNCLDRADKEFISINALNCSDNLELDDIQNVRSDFYECNDNLAMYWQIPSINAFHSVVTPSIMQFYKKIGITRDVASRPDTEHYGLRGLLSCKYLFDVLADDKNYPFMNDEGKTKMPEWKYLKTVNGCRVFENKQFIPMGFMYDSFITEQELENIDKQYRSEAILKSLTLSPDTALKYSGITGYTDSDIKAIKNDEKKGTLKFDSKTKKYKYGKYEYIDDCTKLRENSCTNFSYNKEGFSAVIDNKGKENFVFFSVPYDKGWKAYVNGEETEIIKSNVGFMSVIVPADKKSNIVFKYSSYGFPIGIIISIICGIIFFMYIAALVFLKFRSRGKRGNK